MSRLVSRRKFIRKTVLTGAAVALGTNGRFSLSASQSNAGSEGIAAKYPNDEGIENDPEVLFFEGFESANWRDGWQEISENNLKYGSLETEPEIVLTGKNSLRLDYPDSLLEIVIISDGSTDGTNSIIREYEKKDSRVRGYIVAKNKGKTACLNEVVPSIRSEIVLFSDSEISIPA